MKKVFCQTQCDVDVPSLIEYYIEPEKVSNIPQKDIRERNCVFCDIAHGDAPETDLLYKDDRYVAFRNITPAATHHYLVIPRGHIRDAVGLTTQHIPMLEEMEAIALNLMSQLGGDCKTARIGYHWPPFISVRHLHLHVIGPEDELSLRAGILFRPGSQWFRTTKDIISRIKTRKMKSSL